MKIAKFIKTNLFITAGLSLVFSLIYYFVIKNGEDIMGLFYSFFVCFGLCSMFVIFLGILFPKRFVKDYVEEVDPENYVTVYFYDGYNNGLSKVTRFYGNPNDPENMEQMISFVDEKGVFITKDWFYAVGEFKDNRCVVCLGDHEFNIIDEKGNYICRKNYKGMADDIIGGSVKVGDGESGINFVNAQTGEEMWPSFKKEMYYEQ